MSSAHPSQCRIDPLFYLGERFGSFDELRLHQWPEPPGLPSIEQLLRVEGRDGAIVGVLGDKMGDQPPQGRFDRIQLLRDRSQACPSREQRDRRAVAADPCAAECLHEDHAERVKICPAVDRAGAAEHLGRGVCRCAGGLANSSAEAALEPEIDDARARARFLHDQNVRRRDVEMHETVSVDGRDRVEDVPQHLAESVGARTLRKAIDCLPKNQLHREVVTAEAPIESPDNVRMADSPHRQILAEQSPTRGPIAGQQPLDRHVLPLGEIAGAVDLSGGPPPQDELQAEAPVQNNGFHCGLLDN